MENPLPPLLRFAKLDAALRQAQGHERSRMASFRLSPGGTLYSQVRR